MNVSQSLRLLADENIELQTVILLRNLGYDVLWLVTEAPGMIDDFIPSLMEKENRILLTHDIDFVSALRLSGRIHNGAILIRANNADFKWVATSIVTTLQRKKNWLGRIAVIKPNGIRYNPTT